MCNNLSTPSTSVNTVTLTWRYMQFVVWVHLTKMPFSMHAPAPIWFEPICEQTQQDWTTGKLHSSDQTLWYLGFKNTSPRVKPRRVSWRPNFHIPPPGFTANLTSPPDRPITACATTKTRSPCLWLRLLIGDRAIFRGRANMADSS